MNQLFQCIKKEFMQGFRKGKFWILLAIAGGFIVLNLITFYAMDALLRMEGLEEMAGMEQMAAMFAKTFRNGVMYYVQYLNTYYLLVVIFLFMGCCSKEIKSRQWLLPVSSGIKSSNIVLAKYIAIGLTAVLTALIGFAANALICLLLFGNDGAGALSGGELLPVMLSVGVQVLFYTVLTIALSAITRSAWAAALVPIGFLMLITGLFAQFDFSNYTFLAFNNVLTALSGEGISAVQWACAAGTTFAVMAVLIYLSAYGMHQLKLRYSRA